MRTTYSIKELSIDYKIEAKIEAIHSHIVNDIMPDDWDNFKRLRNSEKREIELAKEFCYRSALMEHIGNSRKTWQIINDLTSKRTSFRKLNLNGNSG